MDEIVLGLPKNMNNTIGEKGNLSIWFQHELESHLGLPVHLIDERLTTVQAQHVLLQNDTSRKKRRQVVDRGCCYHYFTKLFRSERKNIIWIKIHLN